MFLLHQGAWNSITIFCAYFPRRSCWDLKRSIDKLARRSSQRITAGIPKIGWSVVFIEFQHRFYGGSSPLLHGICSRRIFRSGFPLISLTPPNLPSRAKQLAALGVCRSLVDPRECACLGRGKTKNQNGLGALNEDIARENGATTG
jgi:hypothetical protein